MMIKGTYPAPRRAPRFLSKATNMFGPLPPDITARIQTFMDAPSAETWDDIHSIAIRPFKTIWQAVIAIDPTFPRTGPTTDSKGAQIEGWKRIPDAVTVARAIQRATA